MKQYIDFLSIISTRPVYQTCPRPSDLQYIIYWTNDTFQHHQLLVLSTHTLVTEKQKRENLVRIRRVTGSAPLLALMMISGSGLEGSPLIRRCL